MRRIFKIGAAVAVLIGSFTITWFVYFPHSPWGKQEANLKLARLHKPVVVEKLRQTKGAEQVDVEVYTGLEGSLRVGGKVIDRGTAERVVTDVMATLPPVAVDFVISISDTDSLQRVVLRGGSPDKDFLERDFQNTSTNASLSQ